MKNIIRISKKDMTHEEWLSARKDGIGGSEAAAIMGLSKYSSPYRVWADKMNLVEPFEVTEAMRQGTDLEDYVAKRFCEQTGKKVHNTNFIYKNPEYPFALANVDRLVSGEEAGLECKTTSEMNLSKFKGGEFPANYYAQCMHYLMVTGYQKWYLAVLVYSRGFYVFEIERNDEEIAALAKAEAELWDCVKSGIAPEVDGTDATAATIEELNSPSEPDDVDLTGVKDHLNEYARLMKESKEIDEAIALHKNAIMEFMGTAEHGYYDGFSVSYKTQAGRKTFDEKAFTAANPGIDLEKFKKIGKETRPFKVTIK